MKLNFKIRLIVFVCCLICVAKAQTNFKYKSNTFNVAQTNFYRILIDNNIRSKCKNDFSDLRILDSVNNEIPYFIYEPSAISFNEQFVNLEFTEGKRLANKFSEIIIQNKTADTLNYLLVDVLNTTNSKMYSISGSNDSKKWISVSDYQYMSDIVSTNNLSVLKEIYFPSLNYKFIRLTFNDSISGAIHINKIGIIKNKIIYQTYSNLSSKLIKNPANTNKKVSSLILTFPIKSDVDNLKFNITTSDFYQREVSIYKSTLTNYHKKTIYKKELIAKTTLSSNYQNLIAIYKTKLDTLFIDIENNDNAALTIDSITGLQKDVWAICKLVNTKNVAVYFGNDAITSPNYDLIYFKNKINKNLTQLKLTSIEELKTNTSTVIVEQKWYQYKAVIWISITIAGILIALFSVSLLKDNKQ